MTKRLYGFSRTSSRQKKRKTKKQQADSLVNKANKKIGLQYKNKQHIYELYLDRYNSNNFYSYLSPYFVNKYYHVDKDLNKTLSYIFDRYSDIQVLIKDWYNYRDIIFIKIMKMTNADMNLDIEAFMLVHHEDILVEAMLALYLNLDDYIHTKRSSFYTYIVNIFPYHYTHSLHSLYIKENKYQDLKGSLDYRDLLISQMEQETFTDFITTFKFRKVCDSDIAKVS